MQYHLKHIINNLFLVYIVLFSISCSKKSNDDYLLLNNVIKLYSKDDSFILNQNGTFNKNGLQKYFEEKYIKNRLQNLETEIDSIDSIRVNIGLMKRKKHYILEPIRNHWFNDSIFSKQNIEYLILQNGIINWEKLKIKNNKEIIVTKDNKIKKEYSHFISKPLYTKDGEFAIVIYNNRTISKLLTFKKDKNKWVKFNKTVDYW